ncbi:hypothetical protein [Bacillus sp. 03113]|uniref:hypothetical protein n=1 Tax=Bacillus sp. 03113 TaxID=2578211 RepID=UPI00114479D5|nr:hypothetical protein [Bacillus sp. 03113]
MLEFLLEANDITNYYTVYMTLFLGLVVKFLWVWKVEYTIFHSLYESTDVNIQSIETTLLVKRQLIRNPILHWISKYIRRKEASRDDSEDPISSYC